MITLRELPVEHPLRNTPLLGAFYFAKDSKVSREVFPNYGIAKNTYNELGPAWTDNELFFFKDDNPN